ncbi:MAG: branched-chain amino acid ABC transporter permease [Pseudohongiellaceae bacterium]|nr:branched-chain amino acid ABC transporter permease [Pseudohongiellaceae bacterium]
MKRFIPWALFAIVLLVLPQIFTSILATSILNQMAIAIIFALSYNMLLGQGGMLSFGHAVYFGLGGFLAVHAILKVELGEMMFPTAFIPLVGGIFGFLAACFIGSFSTRKAGTVFAMISLGVGELIAASSLILVSFFGGEAGVSGDRTWGPMLFGIDFTQDIHVYYLAAIWTFISVALMYLFTQTPAGRMANAVRDNPERAEFIGYSARRVRFISFIFAGFFAGIAGGLFAVNYEIVTEENLNAATSGRVLLMAYIGGLGFFIGPIVGAIILTLITSLLSNYTDLWLLYLGIMFVLTVMFLPKGLTGFLMMHRTPWHLGKLQILAIPYTVTAIPSAVLLMTIVAMLELSHANEIIHYLGIPLDKQSTIAWIALGVTLLGSFFATRYTLPQLREAWSEANAISKPAIDDAQDAPAGGA